MITEMFSSPPHPPQQNQFIHVLFLSISSFLGPRSYWCPCLAVTVREAGATLDRPSVHHRNHTCTKRMCKLLPERSSAKTEFDSSTNWVTILPQQNQFFKLFLYVSRILCTVMNTFFCVELDKCGQEMLLR